MPDADKTADVECNEVMKKGELWAGGTVSPSTKANEAATSETRSGDQRKRTILLGHNNRGGRSNRGGRGNRNGRDSRDDRGSRNDRNSRDDRDNRDDRGRDNRGSRQRQPRQQRRPR